VLLGLLIWRWAPVRVGAAIALAGARGVLSFFRLLGSDPGGALSTGGLVLLRLVLIGVPLVRFIARWPRHRLVWLPVLAVPLCPLIGMSIAAFSSWTMWLLLVLASVAGTLLARRPRLGSVALLPLLLSAEPAVGHSPLADRLWSVGRLTRRCARNDGTRPAGFSPELAGTRYYAVTRFDERLALVTGERNSRWLEARAEGGFVMREPSAVRGNLWQGCRLGRALVFTKNGRLFRVERQPDGTLPHERVIETALPDAPGTPEYDLVEPVCDEANGRVFVSELVSGGLRELSVASGKQTRHQLGGFNLQYMLRRDGRLVGIDTARLIVYDPNTRRIEHQRAAGLGVMGIDLCTSDDAVAIADMTGRVRVFERDVAGTYQLRTSRAFTAPRRIAFSPDCTRLAITSADDRTVWLARRSDLATLRSHQVGPGLRDVAFLSPRLYAVADACSASFFDVPQETVRSSPVP
jgi:hypothetical protein